MAQRQLALRFGHVPLGRPASLDGFFELYLQWLGRTGQPHTRERFRDWLEQHGYEAVDSLLVPSKP